MMEPETFEEMIVAETEAQTAFEPMDDDEFCRIIQNAANAARLHNENDLAPDREKAVNYYDGVVPDLPETPNRSKMVSNDLRAVIAKVQPAVMRVFFSSPRVVDYAAKDEAEDEIVQEIRDEINHHFLRYGGYAAVESASFDAMVGDEGAIRYEFKDWKICFEAIPPECLLITPNARSWAEASLLGHWSRSTRSDLVAQGFDPAKVREASEASEVLSEEDRDRFLGDGDVDLGEQSEEVDVFELFARIDYDGDGVAELRRVVYMDTCTMETLLVNEPVARQRIFGLRCESRPHSWRGRGLSRDVMDIQRVKTALLRAAMDNLSAVNDPTTFVDMSKVDNPDDLLQRKRGAIVQLAMAARAEDVMATVTVPLTADKCFEAMRYYDAMLTDRTGVSGASAGLMPEVLQGQTATAAQMIQAGGTARTELICRNFAESGLKPMFEALFLDMTEAAGIAIGLKDTSVNVGLGAGSRANDMQALQIVRGEQDKLIAAMGLKNPFVDAEKVSNTLDKIVETAGLRTPDAYFNRPTPDAIAAYEQEQASKPNPEIMKIEGQMKLEQAKMASQRDKEEAQAQADIMVKRAEAERDQLKAQMDAAARESDQALKLEIERMRIESAERIAAAKMQHDERMAMMAKGDAAFDPATGERVPTATDNIAAMMAELLAANQSMMAAMSAPKEVVRDEMGRAVGVRPVMGMN